MIFDREHQDRMQREYDAWMTLVAELRALGIGLMEPGEPHEKLHDLVVVWGEELAQLRMGDTNPDHAVAALTERRIKAERWAA